MSLFDKITHFGYEVEYPLVYLEGDYDEGIDYLYNVDGRSVDKWNLHYDGGGIEFTVVEPQSSMASLKQKVEEIYCYVWDLMSPRDDRKAPFSKDDDLFSSNTAGTHIRLDVTTWSLTEKLRFMRLFSDEFSEGFDDYVSWMRTDVFHRDWRNWNYPFDYVGQYSRIGKGFSTSSKEFNVQYEHNFLCSGRNTIEIRGFGVLETYEEAETQLDTIKTLCDIVDMSMALDGTASVVAKLYYSWRAVLKGNVDAKIDEWNKSLIINESETA